MITASSQRSDDTLHLQLKQEGCQSSDGNARLYTEDIQLQIVCFLKTIYDHLFFLRQLREEMAFDSFLLSSLQLCIILPPHRPDQIGSTCQQTGTIVTYQTIAPL